MTESRAVFAWSYGLSMVVKERTFQVNGNALCVDQSGSGYMAVYICQKSNIIVTKGKFYSMYITAQYNWKKKSPLALGR